MFQGSLVALVTPMHEDGSLDQSALAKLVEFHVENGTNAIIAMGTTGESATLDTAEHCDVVRQIVALAAGRIPVIAGTGSNSTTEAIELTRCAKKAGVDACLLVTPYYNKPTQEGLYQHFKAVAAAVAIPQILYNVPGRTAVDMLNETVVRLAEIENIVGIKDATGDLERGRDLIQRCGDNFAVFSGDDATAMELILLGARGDISVTANVAPAQMHEMCVAALAGERDRAVVINECLMPLHNGLFCEANPIPVKWALHDMGMMETGIRLPLTVLSKTYRNSIHQALQQAGVLPA
ncbi:4-hydroxy-tetrahydrodipicolinate synthase [hydrothermal vent metagenome]|uniref:4-hydroxy-tetrahydrodipicolinate synthase n=1 Tax=hydrothermal vent metagenome TaxID=652676 RepID=A0A3B1BTU8_9ZZZZ